MGMNYYMKKECSACGNKETVHLGKSSAGWTFTFRGDREGGVIDYASWLVRIKTLLGAGYALTDEGDSIIPLVELLAKIEYNKNSDNNHAKQYPTKNDWVDADGNSFSDREFC